MKWYDLKVWKWTCIVLVSGLIILSFVGCKTKYVSVPEYHTEYIVKSDTFAKLDSVYLRDSVYIYHSGDTVVINRVAYRDRYHNIYKVRLDTIIRRDSIPYPVERTLTASEQRLMTLGRFFIAFLFLVIGIAVLLFFWYHNKKC